MISRQPAFTETWRSSFCQRIASQARTPSDTEGRARYGSPWIDEGVGVFERSTSGAGWGIVSPLPPDAREAILGISKKIRTEIRGNPILAHNRLGQTGHPSVRFSTSSGHKTGVVKTPLIAISGNAGIFRFRRYPTTAHIRSLNFVSPAVIQSGNLASMDTPTGTTQKFAPNARLGGNDHDGRPHNSSAMYLLNRTRSKAFRCPNKLVSVPSEPLCFGLL